VKEIKRISTARFSKLENAPGLYDTMPGWWWWRDLIMFRCPRGHDVHLPHAIASDGTVEPEVACPARNGAGELCFHERIRLLDWTGGRIERRPYASARDQRIAELLEERAKRATGAGARSLGQA